jgi:hypothetical protein
MKHHLECEASICPFDPNLEINKESWCWYPDEQICKKSPYSNIQRSQIKLRKLYLAGHIHTDRYFTAEDLMSMRRVGRGVKGRSSRAILESYGSKSERKGGKS